MSNAESTLSRVMVALGMKPKDAIEINLEQIKTQDGQAIFDAEAFEIGQMVSVVTPDGMIPVPQGEYILEGDIVIVVDEKGNIAEISNVGEESAEEETEMQNAPMKEQTGKPVASNVPTSPKKMTETISKTMEYSNEISELRDELNALKMQFSSVVDENQELRNRMATEEAPRTYANPEVVAHSDVKFKLGAKREETIEDRVFSQLFR